jgi:hypothetical protein
MFPLPPCVFAGRDVEDEVVDELGASDIKLGSGLSAFAGILGCARHTMLACGDPLLQRNSQRCVHVPHQNGPFNAVLNLLRNGEEIGEQLVAP